VPSSVLIGKQFGSGRKQRRFSAAILRLGGRVSLSHVLNQFSKLNETAKASIIRWARRTFSENTTQTLVDALDNALHAALACDLDHLLHAKRCGKWDGAKTVTVILR